MTLKILLKEKKDSKLRRGGKPASEDEIKQVVRGYTNGENVSKLAEGMYRSPAFCKNIITRLGIPEKCQKL